MDIGMVSRNRDSAIEEFKTKFGSSGEWFLKVINQVIKLQEGGQKITDILIREGVPPLFAVLKNFFSVDKLEDLRVGRDEMREFVRTALNYSERTGDYLAFEERCLKSVDFSFSMYGIGSFRVNYSSDMNGDTLNIRVLDFVIPDFEDVLLPEVYERYFRKSLLLKKKVFVVNRETYVMMVNGGGLIIHAGETGSGKTTTIASELQFLADNTNGLIITYENPVEYRFLPFLYPRVRQLEIGRHISYEDIHFHFLRNSPSVGMVGEVRNREEFVQVLDLASRGHLVITTMHARNVVESVLAFINVISKEMRELFFSMVRAIVCHRLMVNRNCEIVPFYEVLFFDPLIRSFFLKEKELNYQKVCNYFYQEQKSMLVKNGLFYPFTLSLEERIKERLVLGEDEKRYALSLIST